MHLKNHSIFDITLESMNLHTCKAGGKHYFTAMHIERALKCVIGQKSVELHSTKMDGWLHELCSFIS